VEVCLSEMKDYLSLRKLLGNKIYQTWFKQLENDGSAVLLGGFFFFNQ
jgi:hypothetical protein